MARQTERRRTHDQRSFDHAESPWKRQQESQSHEREQRDGDPERRVRAQQVEHPPELTHLEKPAGGGKRYGAADDAGLLAEECRCT